MGSYPTDELPAELRIASSYCSGQAAHLFASGMKFDRRLARIVSQASEPILAQMRLAWWREELSKPATERPQGDTVLDEIGAVWGDDVNVLLSLIDGWEHLLADPPLTKSAAESFGRGRASMFGELAVRTVSHAHAASCEAIGLRWALTDAALHSSNMDERKLLAELARTIPQERLSLPRSLRGLVVLNALTKRSLARGVAPLMEGRGAGLTAFKVGLLGH